MKFFSKKQNGIRSLRFSPMRAHNMPLTNTRVWRTISKLLPKLQNVTVHSDKKSAVHRVNLL